MVGIVTTLGTLFASLVVGLIATLQFADFFGLGDEFMLVIAALCTFAVVSVAVFAMSARRAQRANVLGWTALVLTFPAVAFALAPQYVERIATYSASPFSFDSERDTQIAIEGVVPMLLVVLVQWGLVRRRWLRARGEEDMALWPWVTTVLAGILILNPVGLALLRSAAHQSVTAAPTNSSAVIAIVATLGIVVVAAGIECYIRGRLLRRRLVASHLAADAAEMKI